MMYLKPNDESLKKVFSNYSSVDKKKHFPENLLIKAGNKVGLTAEELNVMRTIKTEEDLAKLCIH